MMTVICIMILAYLIMGKKVDSLVEKVKDVNWKEKSVELLEKLKPYVKTVGRTAARPILQFYYVMTDENTSNMDRILVYAAIAYTVSPVSLIPAAVYKLLGVLDEGAAVLFVYNKVKDKITPEINEKVEQTINDWLGCEYSLVK